MDDKTSRVLKLLSLSLYCIFYPNLGVRAVYNLRDQHHRPAGGGDAAHLLHLYIQGTG